MANRIVVGHHSTLEVLKVRPAAVTKFFITDKFKNKKWSKDFEPYLKKTKAPVLTKNENFFNALSKNHQGVGCEVNALPEWPNNLEKKEKSFLLGLDGVVDPHNLGAILRTAWLMGVDGVLVAEKEAVPLTPTVCKVASGGAEHVPIKKVTNLKHEISDLKEKGFWSYALAVDPSAQSLKEVIKSEKTILIAGAEEKGIRPTLIKDSDFKVFISQIDSEASYNVSVSVALAVWSLIP